MDKKKIADPPKAVAVPMDAPDTPEEPASAEAPAAQEPAGPPEAAPESPVVPEERHGAAEGLAGQAAAAESRITADGDVKPDVIIQAAQPAKKESDLDPKARQRIRSLVAAVKRKETEYKEAKTEAKECKEELDAAHKALVRECEALEAPFPIMDHSPKSNGQAAAPTAPPAQDDESWKATPLAEIFAGLSSGITESVEEKGLKTLGELSEWLKDDRNHLTDIAGIGPAKAEKMQDAMEQFWKRWRERPGPDDVVAADPYAEGKDAAIAGKSDCDNPYPGVVDGKPNDKHLSWNDGWQSVKDEMVRDEADLEDEEDEEFEN